jgi:hypothetical protein
MNIKNLYILWNVVFCLLVSPALWAEPPPLMHVDDIQPGMKGIGKTVFSGTTIEDFDVEILGVLKNQAPHSDTIMARISGGPVPIEKSGVIAGMSGSPIYIDGKLIGALAFTSIFPKEPIIAGITPIHEMLDDAARVASTPDISHNLAFIPGFADTSLQPFNLVPIQTPLMVSGTDPRVLSLMKEHLTPFNMFPIPVGNVSRAIAQNADTDLNPGSAVGIQLVRGDMDISAVGTVTYRDSDRILAFGHSMFFAGNVNFPMAPAYVHLIVPNQINSFKMASPLETVGTITQDRRTGISGVLGLTPRMIPLNVTVQYDGEQGAGKQYFFEVIDYPLFVPLLMNMVGTEALLATENIVGDTTIRTHTTLTFKNHPPLIFEDLFTGNQNIPAAIIKAFAPLGILMGNNFEPVSLEQVSLEITVKNTIQFAEIVGFRVQDNMVRPGETVETTVSLRPYGKDLTTITETITIPEDLQQEKIYLLVSDVNFNNMFEASRAAAKFQPQNLDQLMELLGKQVGRNYIVMSLFQMKPGAVVQGQELPSPPVSMMTLIRSTKRYAGKSTLTQGRILMQKNVPTQYLVSGYGILELVVNHSDKGVAVETEESTKPIQGESPQ